MRKTVCALMLLCMLSLCLPTASAAEQWGSIQVKLDPGDLAVVNGAVTLYQVGIKMEDGYRITDSFGGGIIRGEDAESSSLAQWLAESADAEGITMLLDADGYAGFGDLEEGLYLLVQTERIDGFYPILPILISVPEDTAWNVEISRQLLPVMTEIPKTGQSPIPYLGLLGMLLSSAGLYLCYRKSRK